MDNYQNLISTLALTLGVSWASGINLYAAMLALGLAAGQGWLDLPESLAVLQEPVVILAAGLMFCVEFFADKTPGVDTLWDGIHSFIRIPAGALLAAGAMGELGLGPEIAAAIVGGGVAATAHATKASARMLINTSPEPVSNWVASLSEDALVLSGLWLALQHPSIFLMLLVIFLGLSIWLLPKIWRVLGNLFRRFKVAFKHKTRLAGSAGQAWKAARPEAMSDPAPVKDEASDGETMVSALERLVRLRSQGALSQQEFDQCKARLLQIEKP